MTLILLEGPVLEPVTLTDARAHLRLDADDEDALVIALISVARSCLEAETRRAFITQRWTLLLDSWPGLSVTLPLLPVQSVEEVRVAGEIVDASIYNADCRGEVARLFLNKGRSWPHPHSFLSGIEIDFTAGYGAPADVPAPICQAIRMLVAHWFETREPVVMGAPAIELPSTVARLIAPYRRPRL